LYLSSFRLGDHPEQLTALVSGRGRIAVVANAIDMADAETRSAGVQLELEALRSLGLDPVEVDLRAFGSADQALDDLAGYDALWVRGGNVFVLRAALASSGADEAIRTLIARDAVVYSGYSAGPCVLAPSLRGIEMVDRLDDVADAYGVEPIWTGLDVLPYWIVPHVDSPDHPESDDCNRLRARYEQQGIPHRALRDGQALVVNGADTMLV
jgi:dipeptidase E